MGVEILSTVDLLSHALLQLPPLSKRSGAGSGAATAAPASFHPDLRGSGLRGMRRKRSEVVSQMTDCMTVSSNEEGVWEYVSDGGQTRHVTGPRYLY